MRLRTILNIEGIVLMMVGAVMVFPLGFAVFYKETREINSFLLSMAITIVFGLAIYALTKNDIMVTLKESFLIGAFSWLLIPLFAGLPYVFSSVFINWADAYFEAVSGFTTTGATVIEDVEIVAKSMLLWRSFTQWLGGIGILLVFVAIIPKSGMGGSQLLKAEIPGPIVGKVVPRAKQNAKYILTVYTVLTLIGIVVLYMAGLNLYEALNHTFTSIATGGFSTRNGGLSTLQNPLAEFAVMLFMIIGGGNMALYYVAFVKKNPFLIFKDEEFRAYLVVLIFATIIVTINLFFGFYGNLFQTIRFASFQVVSLITGTGHVTYDFDQWTHGARMILLVLMFFGGCQCSTTGGIKMVRLLIAVKFICREIKKYLHPTFVGPIRINKNPVAEPIVINVIGFFILYFIFFFISALLLAGYGYDQISSLSASAALLGNVGPAMGIFGPMFNYAELPSLLKLWLSLVMVAGRLEIYPMLVLLMALRPGKF